MNGDLQTLHEKQVDNDAMSYGLSPLHCTIRGFEYILHLGYRMEIKKHQVRAGDKEKVKERKEKIQKNFRERLGLVVDMPKVGFGNTNTGNLARRAFANAEQFSEITGVEEELIVRLRTILKAITSGYLLNTLNYILIIVIAHFHTLWKTIRGTFCLQQSTKC